MLYKKDNLSRWLFFCILRLPKFKNDSSETTSFILDNFNLSLAFKLNQIRFKIIYSRYLFLLIFFIRIFQLLFADYSLMRIRFRKRRDSDEFSYLTFIRRLSALLQHTLHDTKHLRCTRLVLMITHSHNSLLQNIPITNLIALLFIRGDIYRILRKYLTL